MCIRDSISGIASELDTFFAVTWSRVKAESLKDPEIMSLAKYIINGFPDSRSSMPDNIKRFENTSIAVMGWPCSKTELLSPSR